MNLTQKQLASLASVSTPTVSRFEQVDKDIQLSSVLAILGVLGMTDKREVIFPDDTFKKDIEDRINFWGLEGDKRVLMRITREALEDHFSDRDRLNEEDAFRKYRKKIEVLARQKYLLDQLEPDGTVMIRTADIE